MNCRELALVNASGSDTLARARPVELQALNVVGLVTSNSLAPLVDAALDRLRGLGESPELAQRIASFVRDSRVKAARREKAALGEGQ